MFHLCTRAYLNLNVHVRSINSLNIFSRMAHTNRLALEKSPYLLQHKHNPIDWHPWGQEAFALAKERNVPIFLSVGYSTCHWCHVMEKESFENDDTAKILNDNFVSIKVDREERPDVDKLYMTFIQAISGSGGWPMSVFLTPELAPITGGTYFPPDDVRGRPGFPTILKMIAEKWKEDPQLLGGQGRALLEAIKKSLVSKSGEIPPLETVRRGAFEYMRARFDKVNGGFGDAPKFPKPVDLDFLINFAVWNSGSLEGKLATEMLDRTLDAMNRGGIHDHIGKGFHRYSVDSGWHVPHFEKMLYDQAQLLATYSEFQQLTGKFADTVKDIIEYVDTNLTHKDGGFYSAEDADSLAHEGDAHKKEGAFCVWTQAEIEEVLKNWKAGEKQLAEIVCKYYGVLPEGNVPPHSDPHGELTEQNVLIMHKTHAEYSQEFGLNEMELTSAIDEAKAFLGARRALRPRPHLDSKMVTSWQGLMISGLSKAFVALKEEHILEKAEKNICFIKENLVDEDGYLRRAAYTADDGEVDQIATPISAFSDDYAFLIQGLLDLYSVTLKEEHLKWAFDLQKRMDDRLWDSEHEGGYFLSPSGPSEGLDVRMMEDQDGAEPCTNSVSLCNLVRFSEFSDKDEYKNRAEKILKAASQRLAKYPYILCKMIAAFTRMDEGFTKIVVVGPKTDARTRTYIDYIQGVHVWNKCLVHLETDSEPSWLESQSSLLPTLRKVAQPTVFICEGNVCGMPITSGQDLKNKLDELKSKIVFASDSN